VIFIGIDSERPIVDLIQTYARPRYQFAAIGVEFESNVLQRVGRIRNEVGFCGK